MAASRTPESPRSISVDLATCPVCGKTFIPRPTGKPQVYCTVKCKRRAEYLRKKGEAVTPPAPKSRKPVRKRKPKPVDSEPEISSEKFDDMMDPPGSYEDMLRLSRRSLLIALNEAKPRDLPAISKQLLLVSRELEQFDDETSLLDEDDEVETDDESFKQAAI